MPLYDYECCVSWEDMRPVSERMSACPQCGRNTSPSITFRGALCGLSTPGSATTKWSHGGMWGRTRNTESPHLGRLRTMYESGGFDHADNRSRQSALVWMRTHEMAKAEGDSASARHIEGRMARLVETRDRELRGEPEQVVKGVRKTVSTHRRKVNGADGPGTEVTRVIKYT